MKIYIYIKDTLYNLYRFMLQCLLKQLMEIISRIAQMTQNHQYSKLNYWQMGNCVHKEDNDKVKQIKPKAVQPMKNNPSFSGKPTIEIEKIQGSTFTVKLNHSPLANCQFLHQKFLHSANKPQQINLTFMVLKIQYSQQTNRVSVSFINEKQINIYFILGGVEGISNTGLLVDICSANYVQKNIRTHATPPEGDHISITPPQFQKQDITVILQPNLKANQSMYLVNTFSFDSRSKKYVKKSASLQWSSLSFNLLDIYGAETQFRCDKMEDCSVCLSNPANVILTPCRHMCMCNQCSKKYEKIERRCPICRAQFRSFIQYT